VFLQAALAAETFCRGTGLEVTMNRKRIVVPDRPAVVCKLNKSRMKGQVMFPLKALTIKTESRYLLLTWSKRKFNLTKMAPYFNYLHC
jgi:hypothetical protein